MHHHTKFMQYTPRVVHFSASLVYNYPADGNISLAMGKNDFFVRCGERYIATASNCHV